MVEETQEQPDAEAETTQTAPPRRRSSIPSLIFFGFVLFMLTSHNGDELLARHQHQEALQSLSYDLANYTAWQNGTESNFTMPKRDSSFEPLLSHFKIFGPPIDSSRASYYPNITGFIHGDAVFHNITPSHISGHNPKPPWSDATESLMHGVNITKLAESIGTWDWSASRKLALSVVEKKPPPEQNAFHDILLIHGRIEFTDANIAEDLRLEFEGVHFVGNGTIYGFAEPSGQHIDIRLLPSLVPDDFRNATAAMIAPELSARIVKLRTLIDDGVIDQDALNGNENLKSLCPFTFFAQIIPSDVPEALMHEFEEELQKPTGISTINAPPLSMNGLLVSRDCGIVYEVVNTEGLRSRTFFRKVTTYAGLASVVYFALLVLLSRQMARTRTPASISRISKWSFVNSAVVDAVSFAGHITFAVVAQGRPSLSLIAPAFLACLLFIYEAQYALLIYQVQLPEDAIARQPVQVPSAVTPPSPNATEDRSDTTPAATTSRSMTSTLITFSRSIWELLRTDSQSRFWLLLCIFLTFIVRVVLSPSLALSFVAVMYSSFWLAQILRSARRGRTTSLSKEYLFGSTICRMFFVTYFLACPRNVLDVEPRSWVHLIVAFVFLQVLVILLQQFFGPSFFLPQKYTAVQTHDYHPPMPSPDPESPEQSLGDCAICMDVIFVDPPPARGRSKSTDGGTLQEQQLKARSGGLLNAMQKGVGAQVRKNYSLAPCHHLFHTECLEKWLAIKNICPQCRRPLPPL